MLRLQEHVMRESRMQRLQQATRKEEVGQVVAITKELADFQAKLRVDAKKRELLTSSASAQFARPASLKWPHPPCPNRTIFLSIAELERTYQFVPRDVLEPAIFIFDTERKWVFGAHNDLLKQSFDYKYMCFEKDFLEMLTLKEEAGMVFWFRVRPGAVECVSRSERVLAISMMTSCALYLSLVISHRRATRSSRATSRRSTTP